MTCSLTLPTISTTNGCAHLSNYPTSPFGPVEFFWSRVENGEVINVSGGYSTTTPMSWCPTQSGYYLIHARVLGCFQVHESSEVYVDADQCGVLTDIYFYDASTHQPAYGPLQNDESIVLADLPSEYYLVAASQGNIGSVQFNVDGEDDMFVENVTPYTYPGGASNGEGSWDASLGDHTLTINAYTEDNSGGDHCDLITLDFSIVESNEEPCTLSVDLGDEQQTNGEEVTLTASVSGASDCCEANVEQVWQIGDATPDCLGAGEGGTTGPGVFFRRNQGDLQHTSWTAGTDLLLTAYSNGTATITGSIHNEGLSAQVDLTATGNGEDDGWWQCDGLYDQAEDFGYADFNGTITLDGIVYTLDDRSDDYDFGIGTFNNEVDEPYGFAAWSGGSWGSHSEIIGTLTELSCPNDDLSYSWNNGESSLSITVTPDVTTAYQVTIVDCNHCVATDELTVTVLSKDDFVTTWKTDNPGTSNATSITIPTFPDETYLYNVDWDNDGVFDEYGITGNVTHDYGLGNEGTYTVRIRGAFPRIYFNDGIFDFDNNDSRKFLNVNQWGMGSWTSMERAFYGCENLGMSNTDWATDAPDLTNVTSMKYMFSHASSFNEEVGGWDVSNVTDMEGVFRDATVFDQMIGSWDVSNVIDMEDMFLRAEAFNQEIGNWDVSSVTNMEWMFFSTFSFDQNIGLWDVSNVTKMNSMFREATAFDQDIGSWNVGNVTNMGSMFREASVFDHEIVNWDVSNVTNMQSMFSDALAFDQELGLWDVASVTNMIFMFDGATSFDRKLGDWEVSSVTNMRAMFQRAETFNHDISDWNVSNVTNMRYMFFGATAFDQDLSNWEISNVSDMEFMFYNATLSTANYDALLIGWEEQNLQPGLDFDGGNSRYCLGAAARQAMIDDDGWTIYDGGQDPDCICLGDITGNGLVNIEDFVMLNSAFGTSCTCPEDINGDGQVDIDDFMILNSAFNTDCNEPMPILDLQPGNTDSSLALEMAVGNLPESTLHPELKSYISKMNIAADLRIIPNPNDGSHFDLDLLGTFDADQLADILITDMTGRIVYQEIGQREGAYFPVQTEQRLNQGMYLVTLTIDDTVVSKGMIVN